MMFWVIEKVQERTGSSFLEPKYWAAGTNDPYRCSTWTSNIFAAIRFARREDAENVLRRMMAGVSAKAVEHMTMNEAQP